MKTLSLITLLCSSFALGQVPAGMGGTPSDAARGDFAPPSTGCGNADCEVAAACASADPGVAANMCAATVRTSNALRLAALRSDAPVVETEPAVPVVFPAGPLAPGRSTKVKAGELAPYAGQLLDDQELVRRARVSASNAAELADLKRGNVTVSTPAFVAIVAGAIVAGAAATFGIVKATAAPRSGAGP